MDREFLLGLLRSGKDVAGTIGSSLLAEPIAGLGGLGELAKTRDLGKAAERVNALREKLTYTPRSEAGQRSLELIAKPFQALDENVIQPLSDKAYELGGDTFGPALGTAMNVGLNMVDPLKGKGKGAKAAALRKPKAQGFDVTPESLAHLEAVNKPQMRAVIPESEADIMRSFEADPRFKGGGEIPAQNVRDALAQRAQYRAEPNVLPKPAAEMSPDDWKAWGDQYGVNMTLSPMQEMGMVNPSTGLPVRLPGGTEGTFTIPDVFAIKAENFDPNVLPREMHDALMAKFIRTYGGKRDDAVNAFNALQFAQLSPNAPLTQNEFMQARMRVRTPEDLAAIAAREGEPGLKQTMGKELGLGAASRGGLGVATTANFTNAPTLARLLREKPEIAQVQPGETMRDVGYRVMNQVPGLDVKTASLGIPFTNLEHANTSAVDIHMIRHGYKRLMNEDPEFAARVQDKVAKTGMTEEEAAVDVINQHPGGVYRMKKTGETHPDLPEYLSPEKLAEEPTHFTTPSPYYSKIMSYIDESRGANPSHELFPEQWRLWDTYRSRVEPHEIAHPDYLKLPKMSFSELQQAYNRHKDLGYTVGQKDEVTGKTKPLTKTLGAERWGEMYYGLKGDKPNLKKQLGSAYARSLSAQLREDKQGE